MSMRPIISGLVGGLIAVLLTVYVSNRVGKGSKPGQLQYGSFMWALGLGCLVLALFPIISTLAGHNKEFWVKLALFVGMLVGAIYCFAEAALVKGSYDDHGIRFKTPWTGAKQESWSELVSVDFVPSCSWYTLTFKSGKKIRLSQYLKGHLAAVEIAQTKCPAIAAR